MKRLLPLICALLLACTRLFAQTIDPAILETCNTGKNAAYLSENEKQVLLYTNLARTHPKEFLKYFLPDAAQSVKEEKSKEYASLVNELDTRSALALLQPDPRLAKLAEEHATDMGKSGQTGHSSSKGKTYEQRMKKYPELFVGENCDYGYEDAILIVTHLLIDSRVPSLGHRKNILNPQYKLIGVSIQPHKKWKYNCVMDFSQ
jgi:uncharacterized protein YkwD